VITLNPGSYLFVGNVDLTQLLGGGTTFNDRIQTVPNNRLQCLPDTQYNITGTVNVSAMIVGSASNLEVTGLILRNNGGAPCLLSTNNATTFTGISHCTFDPAAGDGVQVTGSGNTIIDSCLFTGSTTNHISVSGASNSLVINDCTHIGGTFFVNVLTGAAVARLSIAGTTSTSTLGSSAVNIQAGSSVLQLLVRDNTFESLGTVFNRVGTVNLSEFLNNTCIAGNEFTVFSGFAPTAPSAGPIATLTQMRSNIWSNAARSSMKALRESGIQTNAPP
jgi:hypothetical protein